jgi:hypothetical protein
MKRLLLALVVIFLCAATAKADCVKCVQSLEGPYFCGLTTFNAAIYCVANPTNGACGTAGACTGPSGAECAHRPCPEVKWVCGTQLPETARWVVASVKIQRPPRTIS